MKTSISLFLVASIAFGQLLAPPPPPTPPQPGSPYSASASCVTISDAAEKRRFDAVSVKQAGKLTYPFPRNAFTLTGGPGTNDPGRFHVAHASLLVLMLRAWGLEADTWKGPAWLGGSVEEGYAIDATMPPSTTPEEFCGMLRNLLAERFHFTFHFEKQTRAGYELSVLPGGQKFREFVPGSASPGDGNGNDADVDPMAAQRARGSDADGFPILSPSQQTAAVWHGSRSGATKESFRNTMPAFASSLAAIINQESGAMGPGVPMPRIADKTGLKGIYDIRLEYAGLPFVLPLLSDPAPAPAASDPVDAGPNIFTALQKQLGLKLTKVADVPVEVMIVDHADRTPTEN